MAHYTHDYDANWGTAETVHESERPTKSKLLDQFGKPLSYEPKRFGFDLRKREEK